VRMRVQQQQKLSRGGVFLSFVSTLLPPTRAGRGHQGAALQHEEHAADDDAAHGCVGGMGWLWCGWSSSCRVAMMVVVATVVAVVSRQW